MLMFPLPARPSEETKLKSANPRLIYTKSFQGLLPCANKGVHSYTLNNQRRLTIVQFYCPTFPILFSRVSGQKVVVGVSRANITSNRYKRERERERVREEAADSRGARRGQAAGAHLVWINIVLSLIIHFYRVRTADSG